jgi:tetratricopeptide (TPR) repeat protein
MYRFITFLACLVSFSLLLPASSESQGARRWGGKDRTTDGFSTSDRRKSGNIMQQGTEIYDKAKTVEELQEAAKKYQEAAQIADGLGDVRQQGRAANRLGITKLKLGQYQEALELFRKSLEYARQAKDVEQESRAHTNMGKALEKLRQLNEAGEHYSQGLEVASQARDEVRKARALKNMGDLAKIKGNTGEALEKYEKAAKLVRHTNDKNDHDALGAILTAAGQMNASLGNHEKAAKLLNEAIVASKSAGIARTEAEAHVLLGQSFQARGDSSKAIKHLNEAQALNVKVGNLNAAVENSRDLAFVYLDRGQYQKSVQTLIESLAIARQANDRKLEAAALDNLGRGYTILGNYPAALDCFQQAIEIAGKEHYDKQQAESSISLGHLFIKWGKYNDANEFVEKGLRIAEKTRDRKMQIDALSQLALAYYSNGQYQESLGMIRRARKSGASTKDGKIDDLEANVYLEMGEAQTAEKFIAKSGRPTSRGRLLLMKRDFEGAKRQYRELLKAAEKTGEVDRRFTAYTGIGLALEGSGEFAASAESFQKAIDTVEELRATLSLHDRSEFYNVRIDGFLRTAPYEGLARVLIKMDKPVDSLRTSEFTKARLFAEGLSRRVEGGFQDIPQEIVEQDLAVNERLAALLKRVQSAYERNQSDVLTSLHAEIEKARTELQNHIDALRSKYPLFVAAKYPQPMELSKAALNPGEWVLEYDVTDTGIAIYLAQGKELKKTLFKSIGRKDLDLLIESFLKPLNINEINSENLARFDFPAGETLTNVLVADILSELPKGTPLIVVPDDNLGALPFEILILNTGGQVRMDKSVPYISGAEFLGDRNPVSYYQSVTALTLARTLRNKLKPAEKTLAIVDPVFGVDDARYAKVAAESRRASLDKLTGEKLMSFRSEPGLEIPRLPLTARLGESLKGADPTKTDLYEGLKAQKAVLLNNDLTPYRSCVFATHGYFGKDLPGIKEPVLILTLPGQPEGQDGFLRMSEVMGLKLNADMVALTACQSGLGRTISGEGTMGMGRAFQYAGAKSVLMSLWSVAESSSVDLVTGFFKHLRGGKNKLDALKLAREEIRKNGYDHPFFWAPFILVGEVD